MIESFNSVYMGHREKQEGQLCFTEELRDQPHDQLSVNLFVLGNKLDKRIYSIVLIAVM